MLLDKSIIQLFVNEAHTLLCHLNYTMRLILNYIAVSCKDLQKSMFSSLGKGGVQTGDHICNEVVE